MIVPRERIPTEAPTPAPAPVAASAVAIHGEGNGNGNGNGANRLRDEPPWLQRLKAGRFED